MRYTPHPQPSRLSGPASQAGHWWHAVVRSFTLCGLLALALLPAISSAADPAFTPWARQAQAWIDGQLAAAPSAPGTGARLRPEVEVGELDSRLQLAPCPTVEPYLPQGTRLWGRSRIGLRCLDGPSRWNVFLPITVRAWGPAWTIKQPVAPGATLTEADAELTEVDWAESIAPVLALPEDWMGSQATRALMPGQILRKGMVRTPQVFDAGTQVRVTVRGNGFQLAATGEALAHGYVGQSVRVRMPNRKILTGTVRDAETVEISL